MDYSQVPHYCGEDYPTDSSYYSNFSLCLNVACHSSDASCAEIFSESESTHSCNRSKTSHENSTLPCRILCRSCHQLVGAPDVPDLHQNVDSHFDHTSALPTAAICSVLCRITHVQQDNTSFQAETTPPTLHFCTASSSPSLQSISPSSITTCAPCGNCATVLSNWALG